MKVIKKFGVHIALFVLLICCTKIVASEKYAYTALGSGQLATNTDCGDPVCEENDSSDFADDLIHDFHLAFCFCGWELKPEDKPLHLYPDHRNYAVWQPPKI